MVALEKVDYYSNKSRDGMGKRLARLFFINRRKSTWWG